MNKDKLQPLLDAQAAGMKAKDAVFSIDWITTSKAIPTLETDPSSDAGHSLISWLVESAARVSQTMNMISLLYRSNKGHAIGLVILLRKERR